MHYLAPGCTKTYDRQYISDVYDHESADGVSRYQRAQNTLTGNESVSREYDKLVRDKIPTIIEQNDETPITHAASEEEYGQRLLTKLEEEVREYQEGRELEELADILEVLYAIREYEGISEEQLERIRSEKAEERGRFERRIILEAVEV